MDFLDFNFEILGALCNFKVLKVWVDKGFLALKFIEAGAYVYIRESEGSLIHGSDWATSVRFRSDGYARVWVEDAYPRLLIGEVY